MKLLRPYRYLKDLKQLTTSFLRQEGIEALLIDLDDTLVASNQDFLDLEYLHWFNQLRQDGIQIVILSNGEPKHVAKWLDYLDVEGIALAGKPLPVAFMRGLNLLDIDKSKCAMLGDQLFTDVLGANIYGVRCFLVKPLSLGKMHTKVLRKLENFCLTKMGYPTVG